MGLSQKSFFDYSALTSFEFQITIKASEQALINQAQIAASEQLFDMHLGKPKKITATSQLSSLVSGEIA